MTVKRFLQSIRQEQRKKWKTLLRLNRNQEGTPGCLVEDTLELQNKLRITRIEQRKGFPEGDNNRDHSNWETENNHMKL